MPAEVQRFFEDYRDAFSRLGGDAVATYNLMRTRDGWRVLLCTAYEEKRLNA